MTGEDTASVTTATTFMSGIILRPDEVREITGRKRPQAQLRWFNANGIPAVLRADGKVVVLWSAVEGVLGLGGRRRTARHKVEPNWSALDAP